MRTKAPTQERSEALVPTLAPGGAPVQSAGGSRPAIRAKSAVGVSVIQTLK
jgi:hypothetical protein